MARRVRPSVPRDRAFAQTVATKLAENAAKTYMVDRNNLETGAELARRLGVGSDFVSRVLAGERWPELAAVPEWARVLEYNPVTLILIWLRDRAPSVYEVLYEELNNWRGDHRVLPNMNPESADLILGLKQIPAKPRKAIETLIQYVSGVKHEDWDEDE